MKRPFSGVSVLWWNDELLTIKIIRDETTMIEQNTIDGTVVQQRCERQ